MKFDYKYKNLFDYRYKSGLYLWPLQSCPKRDPGRFQFLFNFYFYLRNLFKMLMVFFREKKTLLFTMRSLIGSNLISAIVPIQFINLLFVWKYFGNRVFDFLQEYCVIEKGKIFRMYLEKVAITLLVVSPCSYSQKSYFINVISGLHLIYY